MRSVLRRLPCPPILCLLRPFAGGAGPRACSVGALLVLICSGGCSFLPGGGSGLSGSPALHEQLELLKDRKPASAGSPSAARREEGIHVVASGDTLWGIARAYGVSVRDLAAANSMRASDALVIGTRLGIPGREHSSASSGPPRSRTNDPLPSAEGRFVWPVRGALIVPYGHAVEGFPLTGIVISARRGSGVAAAKSGRVCFVSDGFEGWGKVVVLTHSGGWHTWYAHLDTHDVQVGDAVKQGQIIGRTGSTGRASRAQLGFRILHHGNPVDPKPHLP